MTRLKLFLSAVALALPVLATPASADEPPAFHRAYESGVQVYRGHVPQTDLRPYLELQARERQAEAARAQTARFERERIAAIDRQTRQFAALQSQIARSGTTVVVNNDRGLFGRNDFLFGSLLTQNGGFSGRRGYGPRPVGTGLAFRDSIAFDGARRFDRRGFSGRRNGLVARGAFGEASGRLGSKY